MYSRLMQLVNATDNLYLTPPQQKEVLDYAKSLPKRFAAVRAVEENEARIIDAALEKFAESQPVVGDPSEAGWDSAGDDLRHALRAVAVGVLMDDDEYADGAAFRTLHKQLGYLDWPADTVADLFGAVREALEEAVPPDAAALFAPYWDAVTAPAGPEPAYA